MRRIGKLKASNKEALIAMVFILPWIIGFIVFTVTPIVSSLYYSLCEYNVLNDPIFIGIKNYEHLFSDKVFKISLFNTLYMIIIGVPITTVTAIALSILLNSKEIRGARTFSVIFFLPTLIPVVISCLLWIWMLQPDSGVINLVLGYLGIDGPGWITSPDWAKPAFVLMMIWTCGNAIVIYLAGLQDIPMTLYESADIDGANFFQKVFHITIPMLRPVVLFNVVTLVINVFQWFAEPYIITEGGPNNATMFYSLYLYQNAFQFFKMGYASAMAWVLLIIALGLILFLFKVLKFAENDI